MNSTIWQMVRTGIKTFIAAGLAEIVLLLQAGTPITWKALVFPVVAAGIKALLKLGDVAVGARKARV